MSQIIPYNKGMIALQYNASYIRHLLKIQHFKQMKGYF